MSTRAGDPGASLEDGSSGHGPTAGPVSRLLLPVGVAVVMLAGAISLAFWMLPDGQGGEQVPREAEATAVASTSQPPAAPAGAPDPTGETAVDALGAARAAFAAGDRAGAMRRAMAELRSRGPASGAADSVGEWLRTAQTDAGAARRAAAQRSGTNAADPGYLAAEQREREGVAAWQSGRLETALRAFSEAERAFRRLAAAPAPVATVAEASPPSDAGAAPASAPPPAPVPAPAAAVPALARPETTPAPSPPLLPSGASARPEDAPRGEVAAPVKAVPDDAGVRRALRAYQGAYERLDAQAAGAVYPGVDVRALARAFNGLKSQKVEFERCEVSVADTTARAACVGRSAFVPKVGSQAPRVEARRWTFEFQRRGDQWRITQATIGRP